MKNAKYEAVDKHTFRLTVDKVTEVDLNTLLKNRDIVQQNIDKMKEDVKIHEQRLADINEIIAGAEKMGIVPREEKDVTAPKPKN